MITDFAITIGIVCIPIIFIGFVLLVRDLLQAAWYHSLAFRHIVVLLFLASGFAFVASIAWGIALQSVGLLVLGVVGLLIFIGVIVAYIEQG